MFSRLKAMWIFARNGGLARQLPNDFWTADDKEHLQRFMRTETGAKLRMFTISQIAAGNERAAITADRHLCGWACGLRAFWAIFQSLSASEAVSSETTEHDPADDHASRYRP